MLKTSEVLQDSFGREHNYLRISLTEKCNLRCTYCMPEEGVKLSPRNNLMTAQEIIDIATMFVKHGVNKIRLTGGEPLLRKDFSSILKGLSQLDVKLSLTTNAILVDQFIADFKLYGIKDINVSLDTLISEKFASITKRDQFNRAYNNILLLLKEGFNLKLNVVLINNFNKDEIIDFIKLTKNNPINIRFIEFMPFDGNQWDKSKIVSQKEVLEKVDHYFGADNNQTLPTENNFTARNYQIRAYQGTYGIISSVSNPFCDSCNRIRLTANGKLKNCLFSGGETDILSPFRENQSIDKLIQQTVFKKKAIRAGMDTMERLENPKLHTKNRSMITIGG